MLLRSQGKIQKPILNVSKRGFSGNVSTGPSKLALGAGGLAITGLTYINYMGMQARKNATPA